jgi:long-chain acyl-CoA synthetase
MISYTSLIRLVISSRGALADEGCEQTQAQTRIPANPVHTSEASMILGALLTRAAERWPNREALIDEQGRSFTYRAWNARVNQLANALTRLGIGHGDRVAFYLRNVEALVSAYMATQKLGIVAVPVNFRLSAGEIAVIMKDCQAETLLYEHGLREPVERARPELHSVKHFIQVGGNGDDDALAYETLVEEAPSDEPVSAVQPDDLSVLMYTSGTTGTPKGVMLTHRVQWLNTSLSGWDMGITGTDRTLHVAPLYHSAAFHSFLLTHLMVGGCSVLMQTFDSERVAAAIKRERITILFGVPTIFAMLSDSSASLWDHSVTESVRLCVSGASTISPNTVAWARERLSDDYINMYGLTETSSMVTVLEPWEIGRLGPINCIGRGLIGMETRVVRASANDDVTPHEIIDVGEVGELITTGPKLMEGYLNRPEQTAKRLRHGWFYTGDMVYRDDENYYYIMDRIDDAISVGAEMVYPKEIERVLDQHPKIKQSAVIGVPDDRFGHIIKAFVVPSGDLTVQEVRDFCRRGGQLASFKLPRQVQIVDEIPTNPSGKVLKRELRARD